MAQGRREDDGMGKLTKREDLDRLLKKLQEQWDPERRRVYLCMGTGCKACGAEPLHAELETALAKAGLDSTIDIVTTGCHGFCERGALVLIHPEGILYTGVTAKDVEDIVRTTLIGGKIVRRLLYDLPVLERGKRPRRISNAKDIPFYKNQLRVVLGLNGLIDPTNIEDYLLHEGYQALAKVVFEMTPEAVIEEVADAQLRGRGGGGFPTGLKWKLCRQNAGDQKYVICNADEGDPGAFMDRSLLEGNPHAVLEGMAIGAYAIGATEGYIYIRAEYPLAIERLEIAISQARESGLLGKDILGSGVDFDVKIKEGAGAFVCGEETALIASIEGNRGMPRPRPPFPAQSGLFGKPTNINNVETWGNVPLILRKGAAWYSAMGVNQSKGTKIFSLVGKVNNTGLVEVPMGMTLRNLVEEVGGGVKGGGKLKAVQTGGPSGGCLPARMMDLPIEYETLAKAGSIVGSGGLVVMDESTCMVDLARYFLSFTRSESCGKCTPCRLGTQEMLSILERICAGEGQPGDVQLLVDLGKSIQKAALCGLGQTAPNPVLTTIKYFREEYEEHIRDKHCRAAVCKALVTAPCNHTCPAGVKAHRYVRELAQGNFRNAYLVVRESMPLPSACGLVCFHPCETRCKRGGLDEPIAIRALKGAAVKYGAQAEPAAPIIAPPTGKRVAVVGSGPAGLTAAYYLAKLGGHKVTIFESQPKAGGMLRSGIPRYRLPEKDLERDLDIIRRVGVEIETDSKVESVPKLLEKKPGFDAVFVGLGAWSSWPLGVEGERSKGVLDCITFLDRVTRGEEVVVGRRVAVVGGGNSAIDAARTSKRLGAAQVDILYRRTKAEMPADEQEVQDALDEGIDLETLNLPIKVERRKGALRLTCQRMELGEVDASGRRRPVPVEGSEYTREFDSVISAIGQYPDVPRRLGLVLGRDQKIVADRETLATSIPGVYAGGDAVTGPASVVQAIAHGKRAAAAIDRYLGGSGAIVDEVLAPPEDLSALPPLKPETKARYRPEMLHHPVAKRLRGFGQVEVGYSRKDAITEASRCLRCDLEE
jgi:NADH-quinone oxidoreductase subunit F